MVKLKCTVPQGHYYQDFSTMVPGANYREYRWAFGQVLDCPPEVAQKLLADHGTQPGGSGKFVIVEEQQ